MKLFSCVIAIAFFLPIKSLPSCALPPPEDIPEEILRTEIILDGRSPIDGKFMNSTEYAQLVAKLAQPSFAPDLDPKIKEVIFLLEIRKLFKILTPF